MIYPVTITDQLNRKVSFDKAPLRIISLVPSITELLADLGLENNIAGITKFCIHPKHIFKSRERVGGTKKVDFNKIYALQPDLIIANKEENTREIVETLEKQFPVWVSDVKTLKDANEMILELGKITGTHELAEQISNKITTGFKSIQPLNNLTTLYLIWRNPYMAAGSGTFINRMMKYCGMKNVITSKRYPEVSHESIKKMSPELVLLSSEPYPFRKKHIDEIQSLVPGALVILADGGYFSWYGSRLIASPGYFNKLLTSVNNQLN